MFNPLTVDEVKSWTPEQKKFAVRVISATCGSFFKHLEEVIKDSRISAHDEIQGILNDID